uniref:SWIM-type domain-containing protein n=1 Tax=Cucumis melo TaxID=3656 RepID=A0A9I9ECT7_CUCME
MNKALTVGQFVVAYFTIVLTCSSSSRRSRLHVDDLFFSTTFSRARTINRAFVGLSGYYVSNLLVICYYKFLIGTKQKNQPTQKKQGSRHLWQAKQFKLINTQTINNINKFNTIKLNNKGKGRAITEPRGTPGTPKDSYAMLSAFLDALIRNNPGTYTAEEANDEATKNKYLSTLISACTIDGNSQIVPLTFAVVYLENDLSWAWFFQNLKAVFEENNEMTIVSDAHKSIENGFNVIYEIAEHGLCTFHLLKNLKKNHKSLPMDDSFNKCVRACTPLEFKYYMRQLEQLSLSIRHEFEVVGRHRLLQPTSLKEQREFPGIGLLESIRSLIQKWFYKCRTKWSFQRMKLSIYAEDMIRKSLRESRSMNVNISYRPNEFEVYHRKEQFVVNILDRTCSCCQWDLDLIPCSHVCIALSTRNLNLHLYTDKFYYVSNLINLYNKGTRFIGSVHQIRNTHQGGNDGILPLQVKRPAGRPKKKRFISFLEKKAIVRCSVCGKKGHNCRSCKEPIQR